MSVFSTVLTKNAQMVTSIFKSTTEPGGYPETTRGGYSGWWGRGWGNINWKLANPNSKIDYKAKVGNVMGNSIVAGAVDYIKLNFREAPPLVAQIMPDGTIKPLPDHKLTKLLRNPTKKYSANKLWGDMIESYLTEGNGYWLKVWNKIQTDVVELNYLPHEMIEPNWDPKVKGQFIKNYEYLPGGANTEVEYIKVSDIVHFRNGRDPHNNRKGLAPLQSAFREIAIDNEATNFAYQMLENYGTPSMMIAPKSDQVVLKPGAGDKIRAEFKERVTGDQRGSLMVMSAGVDAIKMGFNPKEMELNSIHTLPELRVTAILKIQAMVLGLGGGKDSATMSNMKDARKAAIENCIIPLQNALAAEIQTQLLPDFEENPENFIIIFDLDKIRALRADQNQVSMTVSNEFTTNLITRGEARVKLGYTNKSDDDEMYSNEIAHQMSLDEMANQLEAQTSNPTNNKRRTARAQNATANTEGRDSGDAPRNVSAPGSNPKKELEDA